MILLSKALIKTSKTDPSLIKDLKYWEYLFKSLSLNSAFSNSWYPKSKKSLIACLVAFFKGSPFAIPPKASEKLCLKKSLT